MSSRPAKRCRKRIKLDDIENNDDNIEDNDDNNKSKYRLIYQKWVIRHYYLLNLLINR